LNDPVGKHRALAAYGIGQIEINKHEESLGSLTLAQVLEDEYQATRYNAADALNLIGDKRTLDSLIQAFNREHDVAVRSAEERAINRLQST
jgi:hypothetical protein